MKPSRRRKLFAAMGPPTDDEIRRFIREHGVTRCPTAAVHRTTGQPPPADVMALAVYGEAAENRLLARKRSWGWRPL
jgi:hypothetical protein